jgi:hypothetical protein
MLQDTENKDTDELDLELSDDSDKAIRSATDKELKNRMRRIVVSVMS